MGVDISGIHPKMKSPIPEGDWAVMNDTERQEYFLISDAWEAENPGYYFGCNWWGWRPIIILCNTAIENAGLTFNTDSWHHNDGGGLKNQFDCDLLASALDYIIGQEENLIEDDDIVYVNCGGWRIVGDTIMNDELQQKLNLEYPIGTVMFTKIVIDDGKLVYPMHSAPLWLINNFIDFLKECGGFQIY